MSRSNIGPLIPGVLYKLVSKPSYNPQSGERIPDGYNTLLVKFVRTDEGNYVWNMIQYNMGGFSVNYEPNNTTEFNVTKEMVSKYFYVSEADRTGGKRKSRRNKSKNIRKSRKQKRV